MATLLIEPDFGLKATKVQALEAELARAKAELETYYPEEPQDQHAVIRFVKYNFGYTFAAIKVADGRWFITQDGSRSSRQGHPPKTWDELLTWIGERNWHRIEVLG